MIHLTILAIALLPVALLLMFIYKRDPLPEPTSFLLKALFYGVLTVIPASIIEGIIVAVLYGGGDIAENSVSVLNALTNGFVVAAIPEEGFKLLALWLILRKNAYFDEHYDGIVYAVFVSLGFAAIENVFYLYGNIDSFYQVGAVRALMAVPGHYAFGVLMGFFYSLYYFVNRSKRNKYLILIAPILAHGTYDSLLMLSGVNPVLGGIGFMACIIFCIWLHRFCIRRIKSHIHRDKKFFGENYGNSKKSVFD